MILHLVTDRRRLAPESDARSWLACLLSQVRYAVAAGIDLIQVRERDLDGRELAGLVREVVAATRGSRTRVVVNERLDVSPVFGNAAAITDIMFRTEPAGATPTFSAISIAGSPLSQVAMPRTPERVGRERIRRRKTMAASFR